MTTGDPNTTERLLPDTAAGLPGIRFILDPRRLRELFPGAVAGPVRTGYLRFKPGVSATARLDLLDDDGAPTGEIRWVGTYSPESGKKAAKARRKAEHLYGAAGGDLLELRDLPGHPGHRIVLGRIATDPKLAGRLHSILGRRAMALGTADSQIRVLRFNPQRRVVISLGRESHAAVPGDRSGHGAVRSEGTAAVVAKITALPSAVDPVQVRRLIRAGVPLQPFVPCPDGQRSAAAGHMRCTEWFGDGDLATLVRREGPPPGGEPAARADSAARAAGAALAKLHWAGLLSPGPPTSPDTAGRLARKAGAGAGWPEPPADPAARLRAMGADVRALDAELADRFEEIAVAAVARLEEFTTAPADDASGDQGPGGSPEAAAGRAVLHGDFSADQVLVDSGRLHTLAGGGGTQNAVMLTDLDRMRWGSSADDLGNMFAVELLGGRGTDRTAPVAEAIMTGYRDQAALLRRKTPREAEISAWTVHHLLLRVMTPFRDCSPGWRAETARILDLAAALLRDAPGTSQAGARGNGDCPPPAVPSTLPDPQQPRNHLTVQRAWPQDGGRMTAELTDSAGRVRAASAAASATGDLTWTVVPYGEDAKMPALAGLAGRGRLVVHRHGRRAVVALPDRYVKVLARGKAPEVARASRGLSSLATGAGFAAPRVLAQDDETVEFSVVAGRSLHALGKADQREAYRRGFRAWARKWPRLVTADPEPFGLPGFTAADEIRILENWVARIGAFPGILGVPQDRLTAVLADVTAGLEALAAGASPARGVVHRDLHEKQLLAHGDRVGVLDFDTAAVGDPALDLGNLSAHLDLHRDQGVLGASLHETGHRIVDEVAAELSVSPARMRAYRRSARLRLVCVYAFRPRWRDLAGAQARSLEITGP